MIYSNCKKQNFSILFLLIFSLFYACTTTEKEEQTTPVVGEVLPSWNTGNVKTEIMEFVEEVCDSSSVNFIPIADRIATFDNDGTLWAEQPMYFQLLFAIQRIKDMAPEHPEWTKEEPYKSILTEDFESLMKQGPSALYSLIYTSHAGNTTEEFEQIVSKWISTAKHPTSQKLYTEMVYQPMLELINYLQQKRFKVFIVSGGGLDFMRAWCEDVYGIPKDQVVGSTTVTEYDYNKGEPVIRRKAEMEFLNDKEGKPISIHKYIGRNPAIAVGNSDGDLQMLRWGDSNSFKSLQIYVHHTDSVREWAYDRNSAIGHFDKGLDEAKNKNWVIIDMEKDWKIIYPFQK